MSSRPVMHRTRELDRTARGEYHAPRRKIHVGYANGPSDAARALLVQYRADFYEYLMEGAPRYTCGRPRRVDHGGGTGR